jgi:hypothetical protein
MNDVVDCDDYDSPNPVHVHLVGAVISTCDARYPPHLIRTYPASHCVLPSLHVAAPFSLPFSVFFLPSPFSPYLFRQILHRLTELHSSKLTRIL